MMLTCYSVPRDLCSLLSKEPRILVGYAGVTEAKDTLAHSPICFSVLQVLFIMSLFSPGFKYYTLLRVFCQIIS